MVAINYFWDESNLVQEHDDAGTTLAHYSTEPHQYGSILSQRRSGSNSCYHYEAVGSTTELTNEAGDVTDTRRYAAFGETIEQSGSTTFPFQYVGRRGYYHDDERSAYYVRRRIYEPRLARWSSPDPRRFVAKSFSLDANLYDYVDRRPMLATDPSGLCPGCPVPWVAPPVLTASWQYGCYCGKEPTPPRPPAAIPAPIDAIDTCCQGHDTCCAVALTAAAKTACNVTLVACATAAIGDGCPAKAPDIGCCCKASRSIIALFTGVGARFC